jgi:hypothetical protein
MNSERNDLKLKYGSLFDEVSAALFAADPIGVNSGRNIEEYDPEAGTILPRLLVAHSADDVQVIVYEESCRWFGHEEAGKIGRYEEVSAIIWEAWLRFAANKGRSPG